MTASAALTYSASGRCIFDQLVRDHLGLVRKLAWHVHGRVSSAIDVEDLIQTGMIALIEAARGYEDRGHAFATYASVRVRGAMMDSLRRHAAGARMALKRRREFATARDRYYAAHGRAPSETELAAVLGLSPDDYREAAKSAEAISHQSIDDLYSDHSMWFADVADLPEEVLSKAQLATALTVAIERLPEREALVLQLYFVEEFNLDEIGATLGVGAARVCQIKKAGLEKLRAMLGELR